MAAEYNRPEDILDWVEDFAGKQGAVKRVGKAHYNSFLRLAPDQIVDVGIAVMLSLEPEIRRMVGGAITQEKKERVTKFIQNAFIAMNMGFAGISTTTRRFSYYKREGPEPDDETQAAMDRWHATVAPLICEIVVQNLDWFTTQELHQGELPL